MATLAASLLAAFNTSKVRLEVKLIRVLWLIGVPFNTSKVRLEGSDRRGQAQRGPSFNTSKVRLEGGSGVGACYLHDTLSIPQRCD